MKKLLGLTLGMGLMALAIGCSSAATTNPTATAAPEQNASAAADANMDQQDNSAMMSAEANQDIVAVASADGRFTTLVAAVEAAGLVETLQSEGPFTVFTPTDEAFAKLPDGTMEALLNDIPTLKNILLYHVVPGEVKAADVVNLEAADTALEQSLSISVVGDRVMINESMVTITDIEASNGVIHVIDTVLLPPTS